MYLQSAGRDRGTEWDEIQRRMGNKPQLEEGDEDDSEEIDYGRALKSKSEKLKEDLVASNASYEEVKEHEDELLDDDDFLEAYRCSFFFSISINDLIDPAATRFDIDISVLAEVGSTSFVPTSL